jgi:hypothetical protein
MSKWIRQLDNKFYHNWYNGNLNNELQLSFEGRAYWKHNENVKTAEGLIKHTKREEASRYIDFKQADPLALFKRDPIYAENAVGALTELRMQGSFDVFVASIHLRAIAETLVRTEYFNEYTLNESVILAFIPVALVRFFGYSHEQYINCYRAYGEMETFMSPSLLGGF